MEFRLLGPFEAYHDGAPVEIGGRRQERCLLAILLLDAGRVVGTDRLIDLLWSGRAPGTARGTIHTYIGRLRAALAPHGVRIATRAGGYLVEPDDHMIDCDEFVRAIHEAIDASQAEQRVKLLDAALGLWRGPLLADVAGAALRLRFEGPLSELRLVATELRAEALLELGRHALVASELAATARTHPTRERLVGHVMTAMYRSGRQADALTLYRKTRRRLVDELGIEPGPQLRQLHQRIRATDHRLDSPRPAVYEVRVRDETLPWMVGGHPALEFCNTYAGWRADPPLPGAEWLRDYRTLAVWTGYVGLADDATVNRLLDLARRDPAEAASALADARLLRTHLYRCFTEPGDRRTFDTVARHAQAAAKTLILGRDSHGRGHWQVALTTGLRLPQHAIAFSAAQLLADPRRLTIHACPHEQCGWLFLDDTSMRRWCSLATCATTTGTS
ncbi:MAG TPA: BTAD domain-containing putative transcriptional regulator [Candidatus Limnocylindrales bacterium]